jgi:hypothetical protein|tara:strand:- start:410 stop:514 length:105 start_codon:yes stop_codon:yes gene_type:complete
MKRFIKADRDNMSRTLLSEDLFVATERGGAEQSR